MKTLRQRLYELLKEKLTRVPVRKVGLINQATTSKKEPSKSWKEKRERWIKHYSEHPGLDGPAGELANMVDGLTPDGYNKNGKKVSFGEKGKEVLGSDSLIRGKVVRISK